jgi:DNA-binding NarL/FixJ family response regulator
MFSAQEEVDPQIEVKAIAGREMLLSNFKSIRILLVEEQTILREGLRLLIERQLDLTIVGEASGHADAIDIAIREQPDIILIDPFIECYNNSTILEELVTVAENAYIIVLTGSRDSLAHRRAVCLGAKGIVLKQEACETLIKAIKKVSAGEVWLEPSITASVLSEMICEARDRKNDPEMAKIMTLTKREREVITLVAEGLKNRQIAKRLFISESTVSHHLTSIFNKLAVADRLQLIVYAYRRGLANPTN